MLRCLNMGKQQILLFFLRTLSGEENLLLFLISIDSIFILVGIQLIVLYGLFNCIFINILFQVLEEGREGQSR